jgi:hypothetical protein
MTLIDATREWMCPNCGMRETTPASVPNRFHTCPRLRSLTAPLVPAGSGARVFVREREDYVKREIVRLDPELGRPVMSIVTERPDGSNDAIVFAPTVGIGIRS